MSATDTPKRPRDMTPAELEALPTGPFKTEFIPHTEADIQRGAVGRGRSKTIYAKIKAPVYEADDLTCWVDRYGTVWHFGQWADGTWFKS